MSEWRKALEAKFPYEVATCGPACVYCGNDAKGGRDHVPPLCVVSRFPDNFLRVLYPACARCNLALMDYPEACLFVRVLVILHRIMQPHQDAVFKPFGSSPQGQAAFAAAQAECEVIYDRLYDGSIGRLCACSACRPLFSDFRPLGWSSDLGQRSPETQRKQFRWPD